MFVVVSTIGMTLNTMETFQHKDLQGKFIDNPKLALVESVCISWFTLEYLLRSVSRWIEVSNAVSCQVCRLPKQVGLPQRRDEHYRRE